MKEEITGEEIKELMDAFKRLQKTCMKVMLQAIKENDVDLSPEQARLLFMIHLDNVNHQKVLAKKLRITPATLSVRIQRMEKAGYLRREVDPNDKRNYIIVVETKGELLLKKSICIMEATSKQLFSGFTSNDLEVMNRYVERMQNNVRKIKEDR